MENINILVEPSVAIKYYCFNNSNNNIRPDSKMQTAFV